MALLVDVQMVRSENLNHSADSGSSWLHEAVIATTRPKKTRSGTTDRAAAGADARTARRRPSPSRHDTLPIVFVDGATGLLYTTNSYQRCIGVSAGGRVPPSRRTAQWKDVVMLVVVRGTTDCRDETARQSRCLTPAIPEPQDVSELSGRPTLRGEEQPVCLRPFPYPRQPDPDNKKGPPSYNSMGADVPSRREIHTEATRAKLGT